MLRQLDRIPMSLAQRRGAPLADAVERENLRLLKWARKKRARGVALMMVEKNDRLAARAVKLCSHAPAKVQLLLQPNRNGNAKFTKAQRCVREKGLQQPIEFRQRLLIEGDVIQIIRPQSRLR